MEISLDNKATLIYNRCINSVLFMYYIFIIIHIINRNKTYTHIKGNKSYISSENWGLFPADGTGFKPEQLICHNTTYI